jgi:predicted membrane protein
MQENTSKTKRFKESTWIGILFLLVGGFWLLRQTGYPLPQWLFTWEMILILFGLFVGIKNGFRDFSWLIFIIIGGVFLTDNIWPELSFKQYMWPIIIITLGLMFIFAPKGPCRGRKDHFRERMRRRREMMMQGAATPVADNTNDAVAVTTEEVPEYDNTLETTLDIVSIFGGVKKKVLSKQFNGGDIVCVFGGAQINLANADFTSPIVLDLVQIFGGAKLVVPANWEVRSEIAAIFGGVDDKRPQPTNAIPEKTLILKGTIIFGGVEVNSY